MAENQEDRSSDDLTEQESPYRLEEFRQKGQVSQSKELTGIVTLIGTASAIYITAPMIGQGVIEFMQELFRTDLAARSDLGNGQFLGNLMMRFLKLIVTLSLPVSMVGFVVAIAASFSQVGSVFSTDPITPDFSKMSPLKGLQRQFSKKHMLESLLLLIKATIITVTAYFVMKSRVFDAPGWSGLEPVGQFAVFGLIGKAVFFPIVGILGVFACFDFWINKQEYSKQLRLTKQEAKQEHKEREGDPAIRARVRGVQREMARRRMMQAVKKADVIITNPTHIAVALSYDKESMAAPKVVAKGADFMAQKIKKIASDAGVPLVENVPLARALYKSVKVGHGVPRALFQAVAEVLAYVYRLKNRRF
jgi:flagellar biosynthetic protein FlhB